jgi:hypothetical protein
MKPGKAYKKGDLVLLVANPEEGWPAQLARVVGWDPGYKTLIVEVSPADEHDDGLREITPDQIVKRLPASRS